VKPRTSILAAAALAVVACTNMSPETEHEVACLGGMLSGAALGGLVGNQFGGGAGQQLRTAAGAGAGAYAGNRLACR
jgi:uncharacterized protein YcfJ